MSSLIECVQIRLEICWEGLMDWFYSISDSLRRPLMILAAVALVMTLKSAKKSIRKTKPGLYGGSTVLKGNSYYKPAAGVATGYGATNTGAYGAAAAGGATAAGAYGQQRSMTGVAPAGGGSTYGAANTLGAAASPYGAAAANTYGAATNTYGASTMGAPMGASAAGGGAGSALIAGGLPPSPFARATSDLVDQHGTQVTVVEPGLLKDYGGQAEFAGQIETLQAFEGMGLVEQMLNSPGQNKVLVIDGGGSLRSAVFDANLSQLALRNGWRGVIIHGAVRNARTLASVQFGVKAVGTSPIKGVATQGNRGAGVQFGGVQFNPGWFVYADRDGVVVSQRDLSNTVQPIPAAAAGGVGGAVGGAPMGGAPMGGAPAYGAARPGVVATPYGGAAAGGLRGTAVAGQQQPVAGAYGQQQPMVGQPYGAVGAGAVGASPRQQVGAAPAAGRPGASTARTPARAAGTAYGGGAQRRAPNKNKKFMGKFIGFCFLLTSFVLLMKSA